MRLNLLGLLMLSSFSLFGEEAISLKNDREGKSFYSSKLSMRMAQKRVLKGLTSEQIASSFADVMANMPESKLCSFDINEQLTANLKSINADFKELPGALFHLREKNEIDDLSLKILLLANKVQTTELDLVKHEGDLLLPRDKTKLPEMLKLIGEAQEKLSESCLEEAYRNLYSGLIKLNKGLKHYHFEALFVEAYKLKMIDGETYSVLEKSRLNHLERSPLDLKSYYKKIKSLRIQSPVGDPTELSDFTSSKFNKKMSRRQRLLEQYSDLQIMLMGEVIKKLRARLESPKVEILVYAEEDVSEVFTLEPMERFRFSLKVLRKEMAYLALNTYFKGAAPDYIDLMTAAFEIGIIPALEVDEIASLEAIWNPKKTLWEKARIWVQAFSSVATLVIPVPYGFLPALALVVIEATIGKKETNNDDQSSLF